MVAGDVRVVLSFLAGKPVAVLMKPIDPSAERRLSVHYHSPVGERRFDRVEVIKSAVVVAKKTHRGWAIEAAIPLETFGLRIAPGARLRGDMGFIASDHTGVKNEARVYWSNPNASIVSDLPHESWLYPHTWGVLEFE